MTLKKFVFFCLFIFPFLGSSFGFSSDEIPEPAPEIVPASLTKTPGVEFNELRLPASTLKLLNSQWGLRYETASEIISKFPLRLLGRPIKRLVGGKFGKGLAALVRLPYDTLQGAPLGTLYKSTLGYAISPLMPVSSIASDLLSAGKSLAYAHVYSTSRIQICSVNFPLWPGEHVFLKIDNIRFDPLNLHVRHVEPSLSTQAAHCFDVPIQSQESPSLAIERLTCMVSSANEFTGSIFGNKNGISSPISDYRFFTYNCGGMVRAMVNSSGLLFPDVPNLGIGANFGSVPKTVKERIAKQQAACNDSIDSLRILIFDLENGKESKIELEKFLYSYRHSKEVILQLIISAQRGHDRTNIETLRNCSYIGSVLPEYIQKKRGIFPLNLEKPTQSVPRKLRTTLNEMFAELSAEDLESIQVMYPELRAIYTDLKIGYF